MAMATVPIPQGAQVQGDDSPAPPTGAQPIPQGAQVQGDAPPVTASGAQVVDSPEQAAPMATISAVHPPKTFIGAFGRWADNVANDIKYGTDETGIGTVLKKMGAHGVYAGNPEAVGDFMASLPLGLLKMAKGGANAEEGQLTSDRKQTIEGLKDLASGGLQAMTMPSAFVAPEAGEAAAELGGAGTRAAGRAIESGAAKVGQVAREVRQGAEIAQPGAQEAIRAAVGAAQDVPIADGTHTVMDELVDSLQKARNSAYGEKAASFGQQQAQREAHASYAAATDFRRELVKATSGDGSVNVDKLLDSARRMSVSKFGNQLQKFMGADKADTFVNELTALQKQGAHAVKMQRVAKWLAGAAGAAVLGRTAVAGIKAAAE